MIRNHEIIINKFTCNYIVAQYLQTHGIPLLSAENDHYYFINNNKLKETLGKMPRWLRAVNCIDSFFRKEGDFENLS